MGNSATQQTLAQKIIARASGRTAVTPGEIVTCRVDLAMMQDSGGPRRVKPMLDRLGARVWDPDKVVVATDHFVPPADEDSRRIVQIARDWTREAGVRRFHDAEGICHIVAAENGYVKPGMFAVGGDSHSVTGGAFGAFMFGIGSTEMLGVLVAGEIWLRVPHTIRLRWDNRLEHGVSAKDMMLFLCGYLGMDGAKYQAVEYVGTAVSALPMQERMTICNMTAELGGQAGLVAPDEVTLQWLEQVGVTDASAADWRTDHGAPILHEEVFDAKALEPQVAEPHSPARTRPASTFQNVRIDLAYIGACTGAKLADLRMAAEILKGRRVASHVRLLVAPASQRDQAIARDEGTLGVLIEAGAELLPTACGACAGYGAYRLEENVVAISTTARNFKGRMGAASAQIYLGSPYTVAASATIGKIADPRKLL